MEDTKDSKHFVTLLELPNASTHIPVCVLRTPLERYKCDSCDLVTHFKVALKYHKNVFHNEQKITSDVVKSILGESKCVCCSFRTFSIIVLSKHVHSCYKRRHGRKRCSGLEDCEECSSGAKDSTNHKCDEWFKCAKCPYKTQRTKLMNRHIRNRHAAATATKIVEIMVKGIKWHKCDQCLYISRRKNVLRQHIVSRHLAPEEISYFKCAHCPYKAKRKCNLSHHCKMKHFKAEDSGCFKCEQCTFQAATEAGLRRHTGAKH